MSKEDSYGSGYGSGYGDGDGDGDGSKNNWNKAGAEVIND